MHVSLLGLLGRYDREIEFIHGNTAAVSRPALLAVQLISIHLSQTHGGRGARNYGYGGPHYGKTAANIDFTVRFLEDARQPKTHGTYILCRAFFHGRTAIVAH
jgi:hypothetical protein